LQFDESKFGNMENQVIIYNAPRVEAEKETSSNIPTSPPEKEQVEERTITTPTSQSPKKEKPPVTEPNQDKSNSKSTDRRYPRKH
jgi:hypothetical protein